MAGGMGVIKSIFYAGYWFSAFSYDEEEALLKYIECQLHPTSEKILASDDVIYQEKVDECITSYVKRVQDYSKLENLLNSVIMKVSLQSSEETIWVRKAKY